jgi:NADH:ubiquinone oxidoreductase subunit K
MERIRKKIINDLAYNLYIIILFFIGMLRYFYYTKNIIIILMCIELMLLAVNMNFIIIFGLFR